MNEFYIGMVLIGMALIIISLFWIISDRKRSFNYLKHMDEKKRDLVNIISDAES